MFQGLIHCNNQGTLDFMSAEIESLKYHYRPLLPQEVSDDPRARVKPTLPPPFRYNPLHDVESIWWVGVWFLFCHRDKTTTSTADLADAQTQLEHVQELFPRVLNSSDRFSKFQSQGAFFSGISVLPESFHEPAELLEWGRQTLLRRFCEAEAGPDINQTAFGGIDELFIQLFTIATEASDGTELFSLNDILRSSKEQGEVEAEEEDIPQTSPTPARRPRKKRRVTKKSEAA
jgi:hypothetical protein